MPPCPRCLYVPLYIREQTIARSAAAAVCAEILSAHQRMHTKDKAVSVNISKPFVREPESQHNWWAIDTSSLSSGRFFGPARHFLWAIAHGFQTFFFFGLVERQTCYSSRAGCLYAFAFHKMVTKQIGIARVPCMRCKAPIIWTATTVVLGCIWFRRYLWTGDGQVSFGSRMSVGILTDAGYSSHGKFVLWAYPCFLIFVINK